ncbi:unnamed protein product [Amoebophrya sp. A25]|nr:unnamed protein product [Amoebophrya sp. A25]|eukprot:GSA25T00000516001.1
MGGSSSSPAQKGASSSRGKTGGPGGLSGATSRSSPMKTKTSAATAPATKKMNGLRHLKKASNSKRPTSSSKVVRRKTTNSNAMTIQVRKQVKKSSEKKKKTASMKSKAPGPVTRSDRSSMSTSRKKKKPVNKLPDKKVQPSSALKRKSDLHKVKVSKGPAPAARGGLLRATASGKVPGFSEAEEGQWKGPFFFVQMADTQLGMTDTLAPKKLVAEGYNRKQLFEAELDMLRCAVKTINRIQPAFVLLCGDIVNAYPSSALPPHLLKPTPSIPSSAPPPTSIFSSSSTKDRKQEMEKAVREAEKAALAVSSPSSTKSAAAVASNSTRDSSTSMNAIIEGARKKRQEQIDACQEVMTEIDSRIPLLCCCGNHDMGDRPNFTSVKEYRKTWGHDYFSFWVKGVYCLVLNSQLFKTPELIQNEKKKQDKWLAACLSERRGKPAKSMVCFTHISPFIKNQDEPSGYFNWNQSDRAETLAALASVGCRAIFSGHYHRNAVATFVASAPAASSSSSTGEQRRTMEVVTTGAVGVNLLTEPGGDPLGLTGVGEGVLDKESCGFRLVKFDDEGNVSHDWKTFIELEGVTDVALL